MLSNLAVNAYVGPVLKLARFAAFSARKTHRDHAEQHEYADQCFDSSCVPSNDSCDAANAAR